ncbi:hypothetical protein [Cutibacterium avidum]|uniref:Uncharacterized protein n=1 Tax=Cutibacterium avidum TaxID=33010 RepID=A0A3E2DMB5_9ACTN|nr:hypothetical protein [Cutibacterium avidum]RFT46529.1 hypothetical protein CHT91_03030 [Cutibacterium avidum]TMT54760.1 hypothetical protein DMY01_03090 [Cutibacterium avidum]
MHDKTATYLEDTSTGITQAQAGACEQLLRDHDAADLIDMLIDPHQIRPDNPPTPPDLAPRHIRTIAGSVAGRRAA